MANEQKAKEIANAFYIGEVSEENEQIIREMLNKASLEAMRWKDEQNKQENHWRFNIFRKNHQEYLDRDREETIEFVQDWLTDNTDINEGLIDNLVEAMREANATKQRIERRNRE